MKKEETLEITTPNPYQVVEVKFDLLGKVPRSWLLHGKYGLSVDWLDSNGNDLPMSGPNVNTLPALFSWFKKVRFYSRVDLSYFASSEHPRGLILIVETYENHRRPFYLPVIIAGTNEIYRIEHEELRKKLSDTVKKIIKRKEEWESYTKELGELRKSIVDNKDVVEGIFEILDQSEDNFTPFSQSEEELEEAALDEKYKEAIAWRGPLFRGIAGKMDGFEMRVHSDDHGQHFHVIHKGKGVNARFSFPNMELMNYISKTTIDTKTQKKIQEFCKRQNIFANLGEEFKKRFSTS